MQEIQQILVWSLSQEDPLEKEMATYSSVLAWKIPWIEEPAGYSPRGRKELDMTEHAGMHTCMPEQAMGFISFNEKLLGVYSVSGAGFICKDTVLCSWSSCSKERQMKVLHTMWQWKFPNVQGLRAGRNGELCLGESPRKWPLSWASKMDGICQMSKWQVKDSRRQKDIHYKGTDSEKNRL